MNNLSKNVALALAFSLSSGVAVAKLPFASNDSNNNGKISKDEYYGYVGDAGKYTDWDTDSDGFIEENEFTTLGIEDDFDTWDADDNDLLSSDEFYDGTYSFYDKDNDGAWDNKEWDDAGEAGLLDV